MMNRILKTIRIKMKRITAKIEWRKKNAHNYTTVDSVFNQNLCKVGNYTYGVINLASNNDVSTVHIGNFCSIGSNVVFMINNEHKMSTISTYPFKAMLLTGEREAISKGDINVEDDVWIGNDVKVMSGVTIGQGAVVGTGAVVTKSIPPYAVAVGVPARVISYRFGQDMIDTLLKIDYSKIDADFVKQHQEKLYTDVSELSDYSWLPQK